LPECESASILIDHQVCRGQECLTEDWHIIRVDTLQAIKHDLARASIGNRGALIIDAQIGDDELRVRDCNLQSRGEREGQASRIAVKHNNCQ